MDLSKAAFVVSRVFLLLVVLVAGLLTVEALAFGAATLGAALSEHEVSWKSSLPLLGGLALAALCLVGIKYVFRPPAQRHRYWTVLIALLAALGIAGFFLLR